MHARERDLDVPIYVDLDGTLLRSDSLIESVMLLVRKSLWSLFMLPLWVLRGPAYLKREVIRRVNLPYEVLPYNEKVVGYLAAQKRRGRKIFLATAADAAVARGVSEHLHLFDGVIASDADVNLKAQRKLAAILAVQGDAPFDYIGDSWADVPMLERARRVLLVNPGWRLTRFARRLGKPFDVVRDSAVGPVELGRSMRLHQWLKNTLIFVPLLTSHHWLDTHRLGLAALGFLSFSLCASAIYLLNDVFDLEADRRHPTKRFRPLARGALSIKSAIIGSTVLLAGGLALAAGLSPVFFAIVCGYVLLTSAYTVLLKRIVLVDVVVLASLYTARILAGAALIGVPLSFWLLAFSMFVFLSLSLVKRCSELVMLQSMRETASRGRDYRVSDLPALQMVGLVSGFMAVLVVALFINDAAVQQVYRYHRLLWLLCPLMLYWVARMWLKTARGEMHSDPIVFTLRDRTSLATLTAMVLVVLAASGQVFVP